MIVHRYESTKEQVNDTKGPVIFLAGPTVRGNQVKLQPSWRFAAIDLFKKHEFSGSLIVPEFTDITESDKGRFDLPRWESNGMRRADCILFWICRTRELWGLNTNSEHSYWLAKDPHRMVYGRPDDGYRIQYNDIQWAEEFELRGEEMLPIFNSLEDTIIHSIRVATLRSK